MKIRQHWLARMIPTSFDTSRVSDRKTIKLSKNQREEATRRALAGENQSSLAREYGCSRAYISLLKVAAENPDGYRKKLSRKLSSKLMEDELERLHEAIRTSTPLDLKLDPPLLQWDAELVMQLAQRWFDKKPSKRVLKEALEHAPKPKIDPLFRRPQPPPKHHISQLSRELAEDPDFVKYYLSPVAERIAWRSYELALADWQMRFGDAEYAYPPGHADEEESGDGFPAPEEWTTHHPSPTSPPSRAHGQRVGKHAKGNSHQKKRKKRKGKRR